jgi:hypothetical protein
MVPLLISAMMMLTPGLLAVTVLPETTRRLLQLGDAAVYGVTAVHVVPPSVDCATVPENPGATLLYRIVDPVLLHPNVNSFFPPAGGT